ncbi:hypothetical protein MK489_20055 [Myxococcota bacterium]|nr:hypothetical protein [Myxococcota bacterium]
MTRTPEPLPPQGEGATRASARQLCLYALLCVTSLLATTSLVRSGVQQSSPLPQVRQLSDKLTFWKENAAEFDVLLFGTSSLYRGIDPRVFDAETARLGAPTRSFNAGIPGLTFADGQRFLEAYLKDAPASLRWVIVEPNTRVWLDYENVTTARVVAVHDSANTLQVLRLLASSRLDFDDKLTSMANHLLAAAYHAVAAGELARSTASIPASRTPLDEGQGFVAIEDAYPNEIAIRRGAFQKLIESMREGIVSSDFTAVDKSPLPKAATSRFRAIAEGVPDGAEISWVIMPFFGVSKSEPFRTTFASGQLPGTLLDLEDPLESPDGKNPRYFSDRTHLNRQGAHHFSRQLARMFVRRTKTGAH